MDEQRSVNAPEERALTQEELSELLQIRRDKLKSLQDAGRDPFESCAMTSNFTVRTYWKNTTRSKANPSAWRGA